MLDCVFNHPACLSWGPSLSGPCFVFVSGQMPGVCACASKNQNLILCISEATSRMWCWKAFWPASATWWKCCFPIPCQMWLEEAWAPSVKWNILLHHPLPAKATQAQNPAGNPESIKLAQLFLQLDRGLSAMKIPQGLVYSLLQIRENASHSPQTCVIWNSGTPVVQYFTLWLKKYLYLKKYLDGSISHPTNNQINARLSYDSPWQWESPWSCKPGWVPVFLMALLSVHEMLQQKKDDAVYCTGVM